MYSTGKPLKPRAFMKIQRIIQIPLPPIDGKEVRKRYDLLMMKIPKGHTLVETQDGSYTLFSEAFQEACHSTNGAIEETLLHYVNGTKVVERSKEMKPFHILEVGFGLGIGFLTTLKSMPEDREWTFVSMELDRELLEWFKAEHPELNLEWKGNLLTGKGRNFILTVIQGDARKEVAHYLSQSPVRFHAIYQDAFSPKRNPALWTKEWFTLLKGYSAPDVILSTYSASTSIRKSLHETGWVIQKGDKFGPKRSSTRATLKGETDPDILLQMERSPATALTDLNIVKI